MLLSMHTLPAVSGSRPLPLSAVPGAAIIPAAHRSSVAAKKRSIQIVHAREGSEQQHEEKQHHEHVAKEPVSHEVAKHVDEAAHEVKQTVREFLSDPQMQAAGFGILAAISFSAAACALLAPSVLIHQVFHSPTDAAVNAMTRLSGAALLVVGTAQSLLMDSAKLGKLGQETMRRLNAGLTIQSVLGLVLLAQAASIRTKTLLMLMGISCGLSLLVNGRTYAMQRRTLLPLPDPKATLSGALSVLWPRNMAATIYSVLTVLTAAMAGEMIRSSPEQHMLVLAGRMGPLCVFARRAAGGALLTTALAFFSLKDGADRGKMGSPVFKRLNLACAAFLAANSINLGWCMASGLTTGGLLPPTLLGVQLVGFAFCMLMYLTGEDVAPQYPEIP